MNNFCRHLKLSLSGRFNIAADVYVSKKKKKEVSYALVRSLLSYNFHEEVTDFLKICQEKKNYFFLVIFLFI